MFITFLTDFGLEDDFVGTCHGVLKRIAPESQVIDITHGIRPGHVLQAALTLANTLPYMPSGVHLAVVDPGVGSGRRPLALRDAEGRLHVGPDNGLLIPAAERFGGVVEAHELANPEYALDSVSRTFHGRDLFSPAAAHLSLGLALAELGPPIDPEALVRLDVPEPEVGQARIRATVLGVDRFGNIALNLSREHLDSVSIVPGMRVELVVRGASSSRRRRSASEVWLLTVPGATPSAAAVSSTERFHRWRSTTALRCPGASPARASRRSSSASWSSSRLVWSKPSSS